MSPLASLFGSQAASGLSFEDEFDREFGLSSDPVAPPPVNQPTVTEQGTFNSPNPADNNIDVPGGAPLTRREDSPLRYPEVVQQQVPDDFIMGNRNVVSQAREAERDTNLHSDRRGMFGMKGTLRDIVGMLGDAFLVGAGREEYYGPRRQQEKWADAMAGFSQGGEAERSAIERAMRVDSERTREFLKQQQMHTVGMGNLGLRGQEFQQKAFEDAMSSASQMMAAAVASGDPAEIENAKRGIAILSERTGIPVETLMAGGSPAVVAGRGATASQSLRLPYEARRAAVAEGNLEARNRAVDIMSQRLGLDRLKLQRLIENDSWDQILDLFEIAQKNQREQRLERNSRGTSRPTPPANLNRPAPAPRQVNVGGRSFSVKEN